MLFDGKNEKTEKVKKCERRNKRNRSKGVHIQKSKKGRKKRRGGIRFSALALNIINTQPLPFPVAKELTSES
jgi:hypothetical protein